MTESQKQHNSTVFLGEFFFQFATLKFYSRESVSEVVLLQLNFISLLQFFPYVKFKLFSSRKSVILRRAGVLVEGWLSAGAGRV